MVCTTDILLFYTVVTPNASLPILKSYHPSDEISELPLPSAFHLGPFLLVFHHI